MQTRTETVVVGAGQAGLALSACLTARGHDHVVLERGRIGERWRSERWDSFRLLSPNWHTRLPGHRYDGPDPDGFMARDEIVGMFDDYARSFGAPVHEGTTVHHVSTDGEVWRVRTDRGELRAHSVVVATGPHQRPRIPVLAAGLSPDVTQLHASRYRNPDQLPDGGVLVVGAGPSGQQLAGELARAGRRVHLAVGRHRRLPRTYRGQDIFWWLERMGALERTVDTLPDPDVARRPIHPVLAGRGELGLGRLVAAGVVPVGRLLSVDGTVARFADDLPARFAEAEAAAARFMASVDDHVRATGLDVPVDAAEPQTLPPDVLDAPCRLDLRAAGIRTALWATGYRRDFSWVDAPVFDDEGEPVHRRGVTAADGLYFLGLPWLYRRKSASIDGVGDDAAYLADIITTGRQARIAA